jgi:hypothetical protein
MKMARFLAALVVLSGLAVSTSYAQPPQPTPKPGARPGPTVSRLGSIGGPVSRLSGVNGTGIKKPH